ncbi:MAG: DNA internalization-related competence protein ComEC/Rec2 [Lachnospiraceae bacterium]|nr:DNA internalization-related competence protein ComEC/Rec2 [Lachnospiraceae bacterium]
MTRRPLAFLCVLCIVFITALTRLGLPPERGQARKEAVEKLLEVPRDVTVIGEVLRSEEQEDYSYLILKQATLSVHSQNYIISNVRITLKTPVHYAVGTRVSVFGVLKKTERATNPGQFDKSFYYRIQGIGYTMSNPSIETLPSRIRLLPEILAVLREAMRERIRQSYPSETAGVISAMVLGDKSLLEDDVRTEFSMGGVSHILAISGLHVSLFGEGIYRLLILIPFFKKGRKKAAGVVSVVLLILYAVMTGLSVATLRAVIMFVIMRGADLVGRTYDPATAIAFAALLIVLEQPLYVFYSGFILSFLAVATITVFRDRSGPVLGLALFMVTLPVICWFYYEFSAYTVIINLIVVPLMPLFLLSGLFGTIFGGGVYGIFSLPAIWLLKAVLATLSLFRKLPYANFIFGQPAIWQIVLYYILLMGFLFILGKCRFGKRRFLLFPLVIPIVAVLAIHVRSGLSIHFLDVGQGDSCVMEMPGGQNIMVDGGSSSVYDVGTNRIIPFLKYEGIQELDYVFLTHMDSDHINGAKELLCAVRDGKTALRVGKLVLPYLRERGEAYLEMEKLGREAGAEVLYVETGDVFSFEGGGGIFKADLPASFEILGPNPALETLPVDENGQCITFAMTCGKFDCLMTGDVQNAGEEGLIKVLREADYDAEVLKVAHHGSQYSTPAEFLDIAKPEVGVISCGRGNRYGHPHADLVRRLMAAGTEIVRTDEGGEACVWTDGEEYWWRSYVGGGA